VLAQVWVQASSSTKARTGFGSRKMFIVGSAGVGTIRAYPQSVKTADIFAVGASQEA